MHLSGSTMLPYFFLSKFILFLHWYVVLTLVLGHDSVVSIASLPVISITGTTHGMAE